jgi:ABC-type cobalamin transport system ATPase subunit
VMTKEILSKIYRVDFKIMEIDGKPLLAYYY